ncbi:MAG: potassium channel family protein [Polaribacter sp.]|uniref:ion channel n=1 Tax=Polaribacter sp. TaxID=1920175 RepID=UPI003BAFB18E
MKKILILFAVLFSISSFSQEFKFKEYSYSQFFKMIEEEKDSVFKLQDALIKYNPKTDSVFTIKANTLFNFYFNKDSITKEEKPISRIISKHLEFNNVQFNPETEGPDFALIQNVEFQKTVSFKETISATFLNCTFQKEFNYRITKNNPTAQKALIWKRNVHLLMVKNSFHGKVDINNYTTNGEDLELSMIFFNNRFLSNNSDKNFIPHQIRGRKTNGIFFVNNSIEGSQFLYFTSNGNKAVQLENNTFLNTSPVLSFTEIDQSHNFEIIDNDFKHFVLMELESLYQSFKIDWLQFKNKLISDDGFDSNMQPEIASSEIYAKETIENYFTMARVKNKASYKEENNLKGQFYSYYKEKMDTEYANMVYTEIKSLETRRSGYLYSQNPSFKTFFKWRINQFLKVFSAYGTEPERAVIFSMYVILLFAFVYLLFPNSWDAHGRKRIMNRYAFFFTYMNKKAGIHEVYLDHQQEDLLEFDEFRTLVEQQGKTVPKFFTATALPLYKWAISGTKFSASILKRVDIMKGTWSDLPKSKRIWKSTLLIIAFVIAILYDIFIKMLNALMLSINTFTTLGFGEIPIKGLPRYLAIIQGFIGWFMLTIFSVSLISQLLN